MLFTSSGSLPSVIDEIAWLAGAIVDVHALHLACGDTAGDSAADKNAADTVEVPGTRTLADVDVVRGFVTGIIAGSATGVVAAERVVVATGGGSAASCGGWEVVSSAFSSWLPSRGASLDLCRPLSISARVTQLSVAVLIKHSAGSTQAHPQNSSAQIGRAHV